MRFGFSRKKNRPAAAAVPLPACVRPECDAVQAVPQLYSPLLTELMAIYCHTRPIGALAQGERCVNEFQMTARSIITHLLEGWANQTDGQGTIDDLLITARNSRAPSPPSLPKWGHPPIGEHRLVS